MDASLMETMLNPLSLEAVIWLSLFAAPLGAFLIFRRLSFYGDALGHASLAGVAFAFILSGQNLVLMSLGALGSVILTSSLLYIFEKWAKLPSDVAMTVSYSGMFALGLLIVGKLNIHLEHLLFGDLNGLNSQMVWFLRIWGIVVISLMVLFWKPLWATVVDARFSRSLGYKTGYIDFFFLIVTAVSVVGMIQTVGIILIAAYLVLPAAAALPWARSLTQLVVGASGIAMLSSLSGLWICKEWGHATGGPAIAFAGFAFLIFSHITKRFLR